MPLAQRRRNQPHVERLEDRSLPSTIPTIASISYGGTGSPQGTVGQRFTADREQSTLIFDSYVASHGPAIPITEARKNAQLNLNLDFMQGKTTFTLSIDFRGYGQLSAGDLAQLKNIFYLQGAVPQDVDTVIPPQVEAAHGPATA